MREETQMLLGIVAIACGMVVLCYTIELYFTMGCPSGIY